MDKDQFWLILDAKLRKLDKRGEYGVLYLTKFFILKQRLEFLGLIPDRGVYWIADQAAILAITIKAVRKRALFIIPALVINIPILNVQIRYIKPFRYCGIVHPHNIRYLLAQLLQVHQIGAKR